MQTQVLMIDSDIKFAARIRDALQRTGAYQVSVFATGQAALEQLARHYYHAAVVDLSPPDIRAADLVKALRATQAGLAVVGVYGEAHRPPDAVGLDAKLNKPYRGRDLVGILEEIVEPPQSDDYMRDTRRLPLAALNLDGFDDLFESGEGIQDDPDEPVPRPQSGRVTERFSVSELQKPEASSEPPPEATDTDTDTEPRKLYERVEKLRDAPPGETPSTPAPDDSFDDVLAEMTGAQAGEDEFQAAMKRLADQVGSPDAASVDGEPEALPDWLAKEASNVPTSDELQANQRDESETRQAADIALQLTHLVVKSPAEVMLITRMGELLGHAGDIEEADARHLTREIYKHWDAKGSKQQTQMQFVRLETGAKDYILYSIATTSNMVLSIVFPAHTPISRVRRQAKEIERALLDTDHAPLLPPLPPEPDFEPPETDSTIKAPPPSTPPDDQAAQLASYTCMWTLRKPAATLSEEQQADIELWLAEIAAQHGWRVHALELQAAYLSVQIEISTSTPPAEVIKTLMETLATRLFSAYPVLRDAAHSLWSEGYYLTTPARPLNEREIKRFIDHQQRA